MNSNKISYTVILIIFYCLLASAGASVTFGSNFFVEYGAAVICLLYFVSKNAIKITNASFFASVMLIIAIVFTIRGGNLAGYIGKILTVSLAVVLLNIDIIWRVELFKKLSNWFAILLAISIVAWVIHFVIPLPHSTYVEDSAWGGSRRILNYFLFREFDADRDANIRRFQAFFLEPGHLGTIVAFFLAFNRFDFKKKKNIVFIISTILSLSASAYFLVALSYIFYKYSERNAKRIIVAVVFLTALIVFFMNYNGGDNVVNELIFGKLTRETGAIEGRVSLEVLATYKDMWETGSNLFWGLGVFSGKETLGAGFILYFVQHGLIGSLLVILAFYFIYRCCKSRYGFYLFVVYIVSFLQRTYPFLDAFSFPFILGLPFVFVENNHKEMYKLNRQNHIKDKKKFK